MLLHDDYTAGHQATFPPPCDGDRLCWVHGVVDDLQVNILFLCGVCGTSCILAPHHTERYL
jgi:hypothetical protein